MSDFPSYYHLSPSRIDELSFRVNLRQGRNCKENSIGDVLLSKDIAWQEKIPKTNDLRDQQILIYTYTHADANPFDLKLPTSRKDGRRVSSSGHRFSPRSELDEQEKSTLQTEVYDRRLREDSCQIMVIMASIGAHHSTRSNDEVVLCIVKFFPNTGLVSSYPAWSEVETDCIEHSNVFLSKRSFEEIIDKGPRLTSYSFTLSGSVYDYTIERNGARSISDETELMIEKQNIIDNEINDERRDLIRKEFDPYDCMHAKNGNWTNQAHIELISADGFSVPNFLMCMPHGPSVEVRYRIVTQGGQLQKKDHVVLTGATASAHRYSTVHESLEFVAHFTVAYVCVAFALLLLLSHIGADFVQCALLSIVPLALIIFSASTIGSSTSWHINHQFTLLYKKNDNTQLKKYDISQNLVLELRAYLKQNFGLVSLGGCGTVDLPTEPGTYDVLVKSWKPIADTRIGESRARLHDFYLGSCLSEIGPMDPVPTSENEGAIVGVTGATLFSKGGLMADYSGVVHVRVTVSRLDRLCKSSSCKSQEYPHNRVKMRETVDEVISRVRRNKRGRMSRVRTSSSVLAKESSLNPPDFVSVRTVSDVSTRDETKYSMNSKASNRTAEVLERVRSRKA